MSRFILRFQGQGAKPSADVEQLRRLPNVTVLDDSTSRMLLVDGMEAELKAAINAMPGWIIAKEEMISIPDPRPKVRKSP